MAIPTSRRDGYLARLFSAEAVQSTARYAEQAADRLLSSFVGKPEFDVVREFSTPLSALVAGRVLQLDDDLLSRLRAALDGPPQPTGVQIAAARRVIEPLVDRVPLYPLLVGEHGYEHDIALGLITLLWVGATSSTVAALASSVLRVAECSVRGEIKSRPELLPDFIEEALRLDPPAHVIGRRTKREVTVAGQEIPANSPVHLMVGAANRDPARFEDPDRLNLERPNKRDHLTFGGGPHHCLGARLARAEIKAAMTALLRLMPNFELVQPPHTIRYVGSATRTLEQLVITSG